ncbi:MAG: DNase [Candidatus Altiarchaeales archaeon ex4484_2]|nr:MAG: DNase [Candidatus Altiarchaeales archaeon ex4484_2]
MIIDAHCHLHFPQFNEDRDEVISRALDAGVVMINSAVSPGGIRSTLKLSEEYGKVYSTLGLSPSELNDSIVEETLELIEEHRKEIVAIGEVGLDYYWVKERENRDKEKINFKKFIQLADRLNKPLVIHSRDAESDVLDMLEPEDTDVMLHCFSGTINEVKKAVSRGYLVSIPASIIYSKQKQKIARETPLELIVLETDSPFLAPKPRTRNEPLNVKKVAEKIAEIKGLDLEVVEMVSTENAKEFFGLGF